MTASWQKGRLPFTGATLGRAIPSEHRHIRLLPHKLPVAVNVLLEARHDANPATWAPLNSVLNFGGNRPKFCQNLGRIQVQDTFGQSTEPSHSFQSGFLFRAKGFGPPSTPPEPPGQQFRDESTAAFLCFFFTSLLCSVSRIML